MCNCSKKISRQDAKTQSIRFLFASLRLCVISALVSWSTSAKAADPVIFEQQIRPLLETKCFTCHGDKVQKAGLDVRTKAGILRGGESGPALTPGKPEESLLFEMLRDRKMPPKKGEKLTDEQIALIKSWIDSGAHAQESSPLAPPLEGGDGGKLISEEDRKFWAFQKPVRPAVPKVQDAVRVRTPVDAFVISTLEKNGLELSPEASRLTLIRRAYFDLLGLPPSPKEQETHWVDKSPDWYEQMIERLLGSPHYGERWGRHWLDLAGYADSEGILTMDYVRSAAWRYRDYVIRSFNKDKPYDRFLKEQIAGDELADYWTARETQKNLNPEVVECLEATGFLRCACDTSRPDFKTMKDSPGYYYQTLNDTMKIVASSTLGLTLECAKCHSHKFDPIPMTDYYRLQAIFTGAYRPTHKDWVAQVERRVLEATAEQEREAKAHNDKIDAAVAPKKKQVADLQKEFGDKLFNRRLGRVPKVIRDDVKVALETEEAKRTEVQKYLAGKFKAELRPEGDALIAILKKDYAEFKTKSEALQAEITTEEVKKISFPEIRALYDLPGEFKTPLLRRGEYKTPGAEMQPGVLSVLNTTKPFYWKPPPKDAKTSGRRLAFAEWLTQPDHPLTARVIVNRIWLHHFGEGIVATPDNFGRMGKAPSHPELLDWLATEFVNRGWSVKAMHRLIMTSSAYRQASNESPFLIFDFRFSTLAENGWTALASIGVQSQIKNQKSKMPDPDNRLLWRQRLRRLEAESIRDATLTVAGSLNAEMYGPPVPVKEYRDNGELMDAGEGGGFAGEVTVPDTPAGQRRSVYVQIRRSRPLTLLEVFDQPRMETNCTQRMNSTVSSQALSLMNSDFLIRQSEAFAERLRKEKPEDPIGHAVRLAYGRPITDKEKARLTMFLEEQKKHYSQPATGAIEQAAAEAIQQAPKRALADLCHMLMSANEFIYVD